MHKWIRLLRLPGLTVLLIGVAAQSAACSGLQQDELSTQPHFVGWVTGIDPGEGQGNGQIIVESQADKIVHRLIVTVTSDTLIYRREAGATRQIKLADVTLQDQAQLLLAGPVPHSFPARVTARQVIVEKIY